MFQLTILVSALFIAGCAAWFSIFGISQLFIGALISARVMALALEIGKLTVVSFVYRYWKKVSWWLKIYMLAGAVVLSAITSAGIYGYLSAAYAVSAVDFSTKEGEVRVMTTRQTSINSLLQSNEARLRELQSYRTNQEIRLNQLTGRQGFLTQQSIVRQAETDIRNLRLENSRLVVTRDSLEAAKSGLMNQAITTNSKVGTFWYVAQALGVPLDTIVKWFILAIVLVFDPLAVALVIAYNFLVREQMGTPKKITPKDEEPTTANTPTNWWSPRWSMLKLKKDKPISNLEPIEKAPIDPPIVEEVKPPRGGQSILGMKFKGRDI